MSKQANKKLSNQELRDLLDKANKLTPAEDDFEKEAMEGFAMLENNQEALNLKAGLDDKINSIFVEEKKSSAKYWLAAAAFILVIGLSVLFVWHSTADKQNNLALTDTSIQAQQAVVSPSPPAPMPETAPGEKQAEKPNNPTLQQAPANDRNSNRVAAQNNGPQHAIDTETQVTVDKDDEAPAAGSLDLAAVSPASPVMRERQEEAKAADPALSGKAADKKEAALPAKTGMIAEEKNNSSFAYSSPSQESPSTINLKKAAKATAASSPCYYEGGELILNKVLKEKLSLVNNDQKFDALLFINEKGKVKRVQFVDVFDLTAEQQKQVTDILKSLDAFKFYSAPAGKGLFEYKLLYR